MATRSRGFTLIELLVVVAILGVLAAIGIVAYSGYVNSAKKNSAENIMQQISLAQTERYSDYSSYFTQSAGCTPSDATSRQIEKGHHQSSGRCGIGISFKSSANLIRSPRAAHFALPPARLQTTAV